MRDGPVAVVGGGGHGKVVVATLLAAGYEVAGILDDDLAKQGTRVLGVPVLGPIALFPGLGLKTAVLGIGANRARQRVAATIGAEWLALVHPAAWIDPSVEIGPGSVVFAGAVIQADAVIGRHAIINTGATVDHDCVVGDFAHVAPGVNLSGGVRVEEGAFLGIGSAAVPLATIGAWATVGAGAVVLGDVAAGTTVVGVPARGREGDLR